MILIKIINIWKKKCCFWSYITIKIFHSNNGKITFLYIDQYENIFRVDSVETLISEVNKKYKINGKAEKIYRNRNSKTFHIGYVIGDVFLFEYQPVEKEV